MYPRKVIVHELLHALGIVGHVDSIEFPDSIMGTSGETAYAHGSGSINML